jgi:PAS domain S-box-containing protein
LEHIGRTVRDVLPHVADAAEPLLRRVLDAGEPATDVEIESGGRTVRCQYLPLRDETGDVIGINVVVEEVTEWKRFEAALRDSEERFRALAENIPQLAFMADATGAIFWYNQRWFEYTGLTREDAAGWGWQKAHHPDHLPRVLERVQHCLASGEVWEDTFPLRGSDGAYRWFLSRAVPIRDEQVQIRVWFGTNTDITEQRRAEEALREADRLKNDFLAFVAHELRAPLTAILTAAKLVELKAPRDPALQKACGVIGRQGTQLSRLVEDLLDVRRISAGKVRLSKRPVELSTIVKQAIEACAPLIKERRHRLEVSLPGAPVLLNVDDARIVQVIANLLNNAAKYMPEGGRIQLTVSEEEGAAVIRVRDEGVGIAPAMLGRIFKPFVQIDSANGRAQGGLGIGLAVVKSLVEMHSGRVEAQSDGPGRGAEFTVRLPLAAVATLSA